ncbi:MAG TPA: methylated-DNA--[protein]-cysteine S-methyltransferase [Thermodesulfobacteriota bacterium]|nr:methylated-DNA--[protein]-cysteine S-methyltransferase [Thermodesulfobacteriota bacterium]
MKNELTFQDKYDAIGKQSKLYEGAFITAVKSTGIFCRPSCRARKPKPENVLFFDTAKEAMQHGFRPCKICKPMERMDETPGYIESLLRELHENPFLKIKDDELYERGIEPNQIRRWFKKHHNMTFQAYQRMLRINSAFNDIKRGETITHSSFRNGYNSLSGFNDGYRSVFGGPASESRHKVTINMVRFTTPLGPMFACATDEGICLLEFTDRKMLETEFRDLRRRLDAVILPGENEHLDQVQSELSEYFAGTRRQFTVALHTPGTDFQQSVWKVLREITYGETRTYKQQAIAVGNSKGVRAVASANGENRVAIVIPCHRVIGSNGQLVGYGGGIYRKKWLLDHEARNRRS